MSSYIPTDLRQAVAERADRICEYCLIHEEDTFFGCEVDHIISEKHEGQTAFDNLAYACVFCNRHKGSDVGSVDWETSTFSRFYNPRTDSWADHFTFEGVHIRPLTTIGRVTARILQFNTSERVMEREALQEIGKYPGTAARRHLGR